MHSEFVQHFTRSLTLLKTRPISFGPPLVISQHEERDSNTTQTLRSLLVKCQSALEPKDVHDCVLLLHSLQGAFVASEANRDESALEEAIVGQLTVALYANALDKYLAQATQVEAEAEWWTDMEDSTLTLLFYLLQSMIFL
jgi:nuclear-control-of-ATPase protein 2